MRATIWSAAAAVMMFGVGCAHQAQEERAAKPATAQVTAKHTETRAEAKAEKAAVETKKASSDDEKALTPMDQSNAKPDLEITREIRQAVVAADDLSFTAKNVKIITRDAQVTLRGAVKTSNEKTLIDSLARRVAGVSRVDNQLEVQN